MGGRITVENDDLPKFHSTKHSAGDGRKGLFASSYNPTLDT